MTLLFASTVLFGASTVLLVLLAAALSVAAPAPVLEREAGGVEPILAAAALTGFLFLACLGMYLVAVDVHHHLHAASRPGGGFD
jgi:hypothetical protein